MSKLEELEEELYSSGEEKLLRRSRSSLVLPRFSRVRPLFWKEGSAQPRGPSRFFDKRITNFFWGGGIIVALLGIALALFLYLGTRGREVALFIEAREDIESGETVTLSVVFKNVSRTVLRDTEVSLLLPVGSVVVENAAERPAPPRLTRKLPDLSPAEEGRSDFIVRFFGREGEEKSIEAVFLYRPENIRARFSVKTSKIIIISRVPLALSLDTPEIVSHGQEVLLRVRYTSTANTPFKNLSLRLEYPVGFIFSSADPKSSVGETLWEIGDVTPQGGGEIQIRGVLLGEEGEMKSYRAALGVFDRLTKEWKTYSEATREIKMAVTPLSIQGFLEGMRERTIKPGEELRFTLRYRNNTAFPLSNVAIRAFLEQGTFLGREEGLASAPRGGGILETSSLVVENGGVFDALTGAIVWGPGSTFSLRELSPGEGGEFSFRISTRSRPPLRSIDDKNMVIRLRATVEARGVPEELKGTELASADLLDFKIRSVVLFGNKVVFRSSSLQNSGPLPPRVGKETTYAVIWEVRNFTNDLREVKITASLPPNIVWKNTLYPRDSQITFDSHAAVVEWRIGEVRAGTGVLTPAFLGAFQLSLVPADIDEGKNMALVVSPRLTGVDSFTGEEVVVDAPSLTTELRDDPLTTSDEWKVVR